MRYTQELRAVSALTGTCLVVLTLSAVCAGCGSEEKVYITGQNRYYYRADSPSIPSGAKAYPISQVIAQGYQPYVPPPAAASTQTPRPATADFIDPNELKVNHIYVVSKTTPVMPEFEPQGMDNTLDAIGRRQQLPANQTFGVISIRMKRNTPWYEVAVSIGGQRSIGWINAGALYGQDLRDMGSI